MRDLIAQVVAGVSVNGEDRPRHSGEFGVLKLTCGLDGIFKPEHHKAVRAKDIARVSTPVRGNTVIISRSNTSDLVGASAYVPNDIPGMFLPDLLWLLDPAKDVSARWLAYFIGSPGFRPAMLAVATGTSGSMKKLSQAAFCRYLH